MDYLITKKKVKLREKKALLHSKNNARNEFANPYSNKDLYLEKYSILSWTI